MIYCKNCSRPVSSDEAGLTRKLINRGMTEFYCYACLGKMFRLDRKALEEMADLFRRQGCTLFR